MAYIGKTSIKSTAHMTSAVNYITRQGKAMSLDDMKTELIENLSHLRNINETAGERATFINCSAVNTFKDFENLRRAHGQDKGVIAHHYYQSFQKDDNVTPEQAHKIGVELAKKMFPNYQVVIATHIDREHLHNHIIVNSCNMVTGQKWYSNKKTLADLRRESDRLCLENGLGVITKSNKYAGLDRTTYQLGLKHKSWKIQLVHDLDKALDACHSKDDFLSFLSRCSYKVRYTDRHITITKIGEKKGIRVDTLARQFGDKYKKANMEKRMGYYQEAEVSEPVSVPERRTNDRRPVLSNWEHFERNYFRQQHYYQSTPGNIVRDYESERIIRYAERSIMYSRNTFELMLKALLYLLFRSQRRRNRQHVRYRRVHQLQIRQPKPYITQGNISYRELKETSGDTYSIKTSMDKLLRLIDQPILYSAKIKRSDSCVTITIKKKDKDFLAELLELGSRKAQLDSQSDTITNRETYRELKAKADENGTKLQYLIITEEQRKILDDNCIKYAYFDKEGKINIAFMPDKAELIKRLIYPKKEKTVETPQHRNNRIYAQLKKEAAVTGEKLRFKTKLTKKQLEELDKAGVRFAWFINSDNKELYNIAYSRNDDKKVTELLTDTNKPKLS